MLLNLTWLARDDRGKLDRVYAAPGAGKTLFSGSDSRVRTMFYSAQLLGITANKYKQKKVFKYLGPVK